MILAQPRYDALIEVDEAQQALSEARFADAQRHARAALEYYDAYLLVQHHERLDPEFILVNVHGV